MLDIADACRRGETRLRIGSRPYECDNTGSYHQRISDTAYARVLSYYREHIYIGRQFYGREALRFSESKLRECRAFERRRLKTHLPFIEKAVREVSRDAKILELGCGCGSVLEALSRMGCSRVEGWDISRYARRVAERLWNQTFCLRTCEVVGKLGRHARRDVDMIIAIDLVEHVLCGTRIVERIGSVLKQNGKLLLEVPVLPRRSTSERVRGYRYLYPEHHLHLYTEEGIVGLVEVGGLLVVQKQVARHGKLKMLAERVA